LRRKEKKREGKEIMTNQQIRTGKGKGKGKGNLRST